jgi:hypothetical protein
MKTVKIDHVVLTLSLETPTSQGMRKAQVNELIEKRLSEGYDEVEVIPLRTNFDENKTATDVVNQYIFRKYETETVAKSKKADA